MGEITGGPHIVVVDDDRQVVRYLKKILEHGGYTVSGTTSGKQAVALIDRHKPDLLILDLNMPDPDGFALIKAERAKFPYLRIMVISGYCDGALLDAAAIFGAIATMAKPVDGDALLQKVREVLGR